MTKEEKATYNRAYRAAHRAERNASERAAYAARDPELNRSRSAQRYQARREALRAYHRKRNAEDTTSASRPEGRAKRLLGSAKKRALVSGIPFTIDLTWVLPRLMAGRCEVTGLPFVIVTGRDHLPYSPSIDRIDSDLGYTPDNCRLVITALNVGKNRWSDHVLAQWARPFLQFYDSTHGESTHVLEHNDDGFHSHSEQG